MKKDTLIHLEISGEHHYFGSITAMYDKFTSKQIGVSRQTLYRYDIDETKPYVNNKCIIRKGNVYRKAGNRKPPVKIIRVQ